MTHSNPTTLSVDEQIDKLPINDVELVECDIPEIQREQGVIPAVRAKLTDESKLAIKSLIRQVCEEVIGEDEPRGKYNADSLLERDVPAGQIIVTAKTPQDFNDIVDELKRRHKIIRNGIFSEQRTKLNKILEKGEL